MKILYSIQATGNGHISRAMELLPYLKEHGQVDIFLSGDNSSLRLDTPVKYRSKGWSLYYNCTGGLNYWKMMKRYEPLRLKQEIRELPVEKYDLVINDFDYITSAACARKRVRSVNFGHQASFLSPNTPRPESRSQAGEWVLRNYAKASQYIGLHFRQYDEFIFTPVIKKEILEANPVERDHITVYLPSWCEPQLMKVFREFKDVPFHLFSWQTLQPRQEGHLTFLPVDKKLFNESLIQCNGLITGGGFETPAEALHLGKKIIAIPIRNQYEQQCNAAALKELGVTMLKTVGSDFGIHLYDWLNNAKPVRMDYGSSIPEALEYLFDHAELNEREELVGDWREK
ncbi:MAG TPA: glycosyltransferase family protein [Chitinophagaceae bacterium]|nr:glycosyltransferase family protein [Chitinophagaceae bacterium]